MACSTFLMHRILSVLFAVSAMASSVFAHAEFQGSSPAADTVLGSAPMNVSLRYSEPVGALTLEWRLPDGQRAAATGTALPEGLSISAPPGTQRGTYVLNWRVVSADGHPIGGALVFSVGEVTGTDPPHTPATVYPAIATQYLVALSMILAVGAALFAVVVAPLPTGAARLARLAAFCALPLALLALGAYGLDLLGRGPTALLSLAPWKIAATMPRGWGLMAGAAAALVAGSRLQHQSVSTFLAFVLGAISFALAGHAAVGPSRWIGQPLMALHAAGLIFWVGGLPPLIMGLSGRDNIEILRRFSDVAIVAVIALVASGVGLVLIRGADFATLIASSWGRLLALKLALVACMLALALVNKSRLTPMFAASPDVARTRLRYSIGTEIALGASVLLIAMCFRLTPPPGTETDIDPIHLQLHSAEGVADVTFSALPPGAVDISLMVSDPDERPLQAQEINLSLTDSTTGMGPIKIAAYQGSDSVWYTGSTTLPSKGPWNVKLTVLISDYKQLTLDGTLNIPNP